MSNRNFIKPAQDVKAIRRYYNVKTVKQRCSNEFLSPLYLYIIFIYLYSYISIGLCPPGQVSYTRVIIKIDSAVCRAIAQQTNPSKSKIL